MRKAFVTGLAVTAMVLGLVLALSGVTEGPSPVRSDTDPMMVNLAGPVCFGAC